MSEAAVWGLSDFGVYGDWRIRADEAFTGAAAAPSLLFTGGEKVAGGVLEVDGARALG